MDVKEEVEYQEKEIAMENVCNQKNIFYFEIFLKKNEKIEI
jgi:hypothetical protein